MTMTTDIETFGDLVAPRMAELGWTQRELAAQAGKSEYTISRAFKMGLRDLRPDVVHWLAGALGLEPAPLFDGRLVLTQTSADNGGD